MILVFAWRVMLAQIKRSSMLMTRNLILPLIFFCCLSVAQSQDVATDDSSGDKTSGEQSQQETQASDQAVDEDDDAENPAQKQQQSEEEKPQKKKPEVVKPKPPKDVFRPSEEISEDLPVPFPVDI